METARIRRGGVWRRQIGTKAEADCAGVMFGVLCGGEGVVGCCNRGVHSRCYGETFGFTLIDYEVYFGIAKNEEGGARTAG